LFGQQHTFKGGWSVNRIANDVHDDYPNGRFDEYWGEGFTRGSLINQRGTYGYYIWEDGVKHNSSVNSRNQGFYVQDQWQLHARRLAPKSARSLPRRHTTTHGKSEGRKARGEQSATPRRTRRRPLAA